MSANPSRRPDPCTIALVGVSDDSYPEPGPPTRAVKCARRALEAVSTGWRFVASTEGVVFGLVLFIAWEVVEIGADFVRAVVR